MPCACQVEIPVGCPLVTGTPAGSSDRICLLSGDGPPVAPPDSVIHIWFYRDNLTGIIYPWNPQTSAWMDIGTGTGGAGITIRTCCNLIIDQGEPIDPPPTPAEAWWQIDPVSGILYPWNPEAAAWITVFAGTGGVGTGNNNGLYWGNGAPATPPSNIYIDNLYIDIDSGIYYWWSWTAGAWE